VRGLATFLWEFVVGDDPRLALGVIVALGVTALVGGTDVAAWWILPVAVAGLLVLSLLSAARVTRPRRTAPPEKERV
jgi:hypothetical protein